MTSRFRIGALRDAVQSRAEWRIATETARRLAATCRPRWAHDATKFLDLGRWLEVDMKRAAKLGLFEAPGRRILDLGSGTGLFLYVCSVLGHDATGLDLPCAAMEHPEREIFTEMPAAWGVRIIRAEIRPLQPLPVPGSFDLIVSCKVCFNNHKLENEWRRPEWEFFVNDTLGRLNAGGRLALRLNHHEEKFGPRGYLDQETNEFFASKGTIDDGKILIAP